MAQSFKFVDLLNLPMISMGGSFHRFLVIPSYKKSAIFSMVFCIPRPWHDGPRLVLWCLSRDAVAARGQRGAPCATCDFLGGSVNGGTLKICNDVLSFYEIESTSIRNREAIVTKCHEPLLTAAKRIGNEGMIPVVTSNNHPSNPQQPPATHPFPT